ncbi:uncharacterized protein LOC111779657 [Cucurbita pepo subsp. pepo]|uniref:uncharacterized protein LOC111779657 n=1 Tax=Cucurbita pepo subsp. pepo TaxID=3664 RepID=UPI000C9D6AF2|nr:uncharacterized protein LOC111779657 [Cucurbita pepo subsp. pepo]
MSCSKDGSIPVPYSPIPANATAPQNVVVLSLYRPPLYRHRRLLRLCALYSVAFLLLSAVVFLLFPSDPSLQLVRLKLNGVNVRLLPAVVLDLSFSASVRVRNKNFFSLDYNYLGVSVGYRGRRLGFVSSDGGRVSARGSSYVNATLDLNGLQIIHDVFFLLEDLRKGIIPFDTETEVEGSMGLFFIKFPIKATVSCEVLVDTNSQTIEHQDCYPE